MIKYLSQWIKHNVAVMSDRSYPNNPAELKVCYCIFYTLWMLLGLHGGTIGSTVALQKEFAFFPHACIRSLQVLWFPPTIPKPDCKVLLILRCF